MIPITTESRYNAMINLRKGLISREIFSDKEVFEEDWAANQEDGGQKDDDEKRAA